MPNREVRNNWVPGDTRAYNSVFTKEVSVMDAFINWFRGLSRNAQVAIAIATLVFMPAVVLKAGLSVIGKGIAAFFSVLWFIGGKVNWGVVFAILCGYGLYRVYVFFNEDGDEDENNNEDDSWLNRH